MSKKNKSSHGKKHETDTTKGVLEITRSGIGYVVVNAEGGDVLVRPNDFNTALNGDTVRVKVLKENLRSGKKEGRITEVVDRKQSEFIGHIQLSANYAFFIPDTDKPMPDLYIPLDKLNAAKDKDRVLAKITNWNSANKKPEGEVVQVILAEDESDIAMKGILVENGFPLVFEDDVMEEAMRLPDVISHADIKKRKDMRDVLTFTIDPVDAKDFDDAISIKKNSKQTYMKLVYI